MQMMVVLRGYTNAWVGKSQRLRKIFPFSLCTFLCFTDNFLFYIFLFLFVLCFRPKHTYIGHRERIAPCPNVSFRKEEKKRS